jgi:methyltransferase (TIGR00027 family)
MEDAKRRRSICKDDYAERFMDERGKNIFNAFKSEKMPNISNIIRHRIIDDYLKDELKKKKDLSIITIGSGFDTRPYRLDGGTWIEIDEPQIIGHKNDRLPLEGCPNTLKRISIDFANETLESKLEMISRANQTVFVIEGVFMYLEVETIKNMLSAIQTISSNHILLCDLMTKRFFEKYAKKVYLKLVKASDKITARPDHLDAIFIQHGYEVVEHTPIYIKAGELGILWDEANIPKFINSLFLNTFAKDLKGYEVFRLLFTEYEHSHST